jgi:hypothetical protein
MARAKVVAIKTIPLWSVAVMTAIGAAWPGRRADEFESIVIEVLKVFNVQVEQSREEDESHRHEERGDIRCRGAD